MNAFKRTRPLSRPAITLLGRFRRSTRASLLLIASLIPSVTLVTGPVPLLANPSGASVVAGGINFDGMGTANLTVNQSTQVGIINWQDFSVGTGESVHFNQPGVSALTINRVVSGNPSAIYGSVTANGGLMVINPNGVIVGSSGVIDVGGLLAMSTLDATNADLLNGGPTSFFGNSKNGVESYGSVRSRNGDVVFLGGFAHNHGSIEAATGTVALASGSDILVNSPASGGTIAVRGASSYEGIGVNQTGSVTAAATELMSSGNAYSLAINNTGITRATGGSRKNGRARLFATGSSSRIMNTGTVAAQSPNGRGGAIEVEGGSFENRGTLDASSIGANDGGTVSVKADSIVMTDDSRVDVSSVGNAGSVSLEGGAAAEIGGTINASSTILDAGSVAITADEVAVTASIDAAGGRGGSIKAGGDFQGISTNGLKASNSTVVGPDAVFDVSASVSDAGQIIVWSDGDTLFEGEARANASGMVGNGGLIEVSGLNTLTFRGVVSATSVNGTAGAVLFDPGELTIGNGLNGTNEIDSGIINDTLQGGTSVLLATQGADSDIVFTSNGLGDNRDHAIQWTNSNASFGAFAGGDVIIGTHIRTSGGGSINLIGGWGGTEAEAAGLFSGPAVGVAGGADGTVDADEVLDDGNTRALAAGGGTMGVQDLFEYYVEAGQFGENEGNIFVGSATMNRHVEVGSRFGDTNLAADNIIVTAADTNAESRHAQVGFRDSGQIFAPRRGNLDLNGNSSTGDNNVAVGIAGILEVTGPDGTLLTDVNGDPTGANGVAMGVRAINNTGEVASTMVPYANHYMNARHGNWWWQRIDAEAPDPAGLGSLRPENGAGGIDVAASISGNAPVYSDAHSADINLIARSNVIVQGGGRHQSGAYVGHGGDSAGWADNRALNAGGTQQGVNRRWSQNGANNDRSAMAIARLAPVRGQINVLAGVDVDSDISVDSEGNVNVSLVPRAGSVLVQGIQRLGSAENKNDDNNNSAGAGAPAVIGHGGLGQFGEFYGDIQVRAGAGVTVKAGSNTRGYAQIGHNVDTYHYWDPPSNKDAQIRFFSSGSDFNDPFLRRGNLYDYNSNDLNAAYDAAVTAGDPDPGSVYGVLSLRNLAPDRVNANQFPDPDPDNSPPDPSGNQAIFEGQGRELVVFDSTNPMIDGPVDVEALDGSVVSGFHGDVTVEAVAGSLIVEGYSTEDQSNEADGFIPGYPEDESGLTTNRDRRYARVGHGGTSAALWGEGASGFASNRTDRNQEIVQFRLALNNGADADASGSASVVGERNNGLNRALTFMTITGDIDVDSGGNVIVKAGNDVYDSAQIGHGGNTLADFETSSFIAGNIDINAGGTLDITGGGETKWTGNGGNRHHRAQAHVGHGGYESGFISFVGDINVDVFRDITITAGAYGDTFAKIGHKGGREFGQVGGDYSRNENFFFDNVSIDIDSEIDGTSASVVYRDADGAGVQSTLGNGVADLSGGSRTREFELTSNTANITVNSETGSISLLHLDGQWRLNGNATDDINKNQMEDAFAQIGHGGQLYDGEYWRNEGTNFDDMVGDILVTAAGDLRLESGNREGMWSRVGHGFTGNDLRVRNGEELIIGGLITVDAGQDVILDGRTGAEFDKNEDGTSIDNGLAIGHGAFRIEEGGNRGQLTVLDGAFINGIEASSTIDVTAGRDILLVGGEGTNDVVSETGPSGTHSQIGHGYASLFGDALSTRGFQGDINVYAGQNLSVMGSSNGIISDEAGNIILGSQGAAGFIGHGGIHLDAPTSGDISVYAGNDIEIIAQQRRAEDVNLLRANAFTYLNFAKIGHFSSENSDSGQVNTTLMSGDVRVVAGNDLTMQAGRTPDHNSLNFEDVGVDLGSGLFGRQSVENGFSQIGHGGPGGISGSALGDIEVLVGNDFETVDGTFDNSGQLFPISANNYVKIGHGDWMRDGTVGSRGSMNGLLEGDIVIAVGEDIDFEHTMVGHADERFSTALRAGGVEIASSRNFPFFGGTGLMEIRGVEDQTDGSASSYDDRGSVITGNSAIKFYLPSRSLNLVETSTLINDNEYAGRPVEDFPTGGGTDPFAGEADEVFLAPDLWWMSDAQIDLATEAGFDTFGVFPTDAVSGQGGVTGEVDPLGGLGSLTALNVGELGSSTNGSLVRGGADATFLYDALADIPVEDIFTFPILPPPPFDITTVEPLLGFLNENQQFLNEVFFRQEEGDEEGYFSGEGVVTYIPFLEEGEEESTAAGETWALEDLFDALLGSNDDEDEERRNKLNRGRIRIGTTYYVFYPSQNKYSSYSVFSGQ